MRLNKFIAHASGLSRRGADEAIENGRVQVNGDSPDLGKQVSDRDVVTLDGKELKISEYKYVLLNKPTGYLSSRKAQSAPTLYELLPDELKPLKTVGRLDKDTSGLILLTDDGDFANQLTHPSYQKEKRYKLKLNKYLTERNIDKINRGVVLEDGVSNLHVSIEGDGWYEVIMREGKNRQIRRTFEAIGFTVTELHRTNFGPYSEADLGGSMFSAVKKKDL